MANENIKVPFNMAIATLRRLDVILLRMLYISQLPLSGIQEQKLQIKLLHHFLNNASPLMDIAMKSEEYKDYKERVFKAKIPTIVKLGKCKEYYSPKLDQEILSICMEIQSKLKPYFMPQAEEDDYEL